MSTGPADETFRYKADFSDVHKGLNDIKGRMQSFGQNINASAIGNFLAQGVETGISLAVDALQNLTAAAKEWVAVAAEAEQVHFRFDFAIKEAGEAVGFTTQQLDDYAKALQRTSVFGDEAIKQAMTMLVRMDIVGESLKRVSQIAVDMASALGEDVTTSAQKLAMAMRDPSRGVRALQLSMQDLSIESRTLLKELVKTGQILKAQEIILDAVEKKYRGAGAGLAETAAGGWAQFQEVVGDIQEALGTALLPVLKEMLPAIRDIAIAVEEMAKSFSEAVDQDLATYFKELAHDAIAVAVAIQILGERTIASFAEMRLSIAQAGAERERFLKKMTFQDTTGIDAMIALQDKLIEKTKQKTTIAEEFGQRMLDIVTAIGRPAPGVPVAAAAAAAAPESMESHIPRQGIPGMFGAIQPAWAMQAMLAGMMVHQPEEEKDKPRHVSAIEDATGLFRRIQTAAASDPESVPKKQLTVLEKIQEWQTKMLPVQEEQATHLKKILEKPGAALG